MTIGSIAKSSAVGVSEVAGPRLTHINTVQPVPDATTIGYLAIRVLQDAAVHIAWREAADDCSKASSLATVDAVARAVSSVTRVGSKTAASWRRHGGAGPLSASAD